MKSIAIVELYQHDELVDHFLSLFDGTEVTVNVFCSESVFNSLRKMHSDPKINWSILKRNQRISDFIQEHCELIRENSFILLTTVFSHFDSFRQLVINKNSILTIHNAHWQLIPNKHIWLKSNTLFRDGYRLLKNSLSRNAASKKNLIDTVSILGVGSKEIENYLKTNKDIENSLKDKIHHLPFAHFKNQVDHSSKINLIIPGIVAEQNRNYLLVLNVLKNIIPKISTEIQVTLLGSSNNSSGRRIIQRFKELNLQNLNLKTYEGHVDYNSYQAEIQKASFLIIPAKQYTQFHSSTEANGYSKIMGTVNDVVKYGIKAILPSHYPIPTSISNLITQYTDQESLEKILLNFIEQKNVLNDKVDLDDLINNNSKEKLRQEFFDYFIADQNNF